MRLIYNNMSGILDSFLQSIQLPQLQQQQKPIYDPVGDFMKSAGNTITQGINTVGKAAGSMPISSIPGSPSLSQSFNAANATLTGGQLPGGDVLEGNATPMSMAMIPLALEGMKGGKPEDIAKKEEKTVILDAKGNPAKTSLPAKPEPIPQTGDQVVTNPAYPQGSANPARLTVKPGKPVNTEGVGYANDNQPTTSLNQGAEDIPGELPPTGITQKPQPIRTHAPQDNPMDNMENQQRNLQIDGKDIRSSGDKNQVNATLNGYGIRGTRTNQLTMAENAITNLAQQAESHALTSGGVIDKATIINDTTKGLQNSANQHNIPANQARIMASKYIDGVYARATGADLGGNIEGLTPEKIPTAVSLKMKTIMNEDAQSTYKQTDPSKWSNGQTTSRFARDATDTQIDTGNPDVARLNNDMSDLYKAKESLRKGANKEADLAQQEAMKPPAPPEPWYKKGATGAVAASIGALAAGGYGLGQLGVNIPNLLGAGAGAINHLTGGDKGNPSSPEKKHTLYDEATPLTDGTVIPEEKQNEMQSKLRNRIGAGMTGEQFTNPDQYSKDVQELANNEDLFNKQKNLLSPSKDMGIVAANANKAASAVNDLDQNFFAALSKGYNSVEIQTNPKYEKAAAYLKAIEDVTKVPLHATHSAQSMLDGIDAAYQIQKTKLEQATNQYKKKEQPISSPVPSDLPPTQLNPQAPLDWSKSAPGTEEMIKAGNGGGLPPFNQLF